MVEIIENLLQAGDECLSSFEVKLRVEEFLQTHYRVTFNFEVSDALTKLRKDGLVKQHGDIYQAVDAGKACDYLEKHWYDLYSATESLSEVLNEA